MTKSGEAPPVGEAVARRDRTAPLVAGACLALVGALALAGMSIYVDVEAGGIADGRRFLARCARDGTCINPAVATGVTILTLGMVPLNQPFSLEARAGRLRGDADTPGDPEVVAILDGGCRGGVSQECLAAVADRIDALADEGARAGSARSKRWFLGALGALVLSVGTFVAAARRHRRNRRVAA